MPDTNLCSHCAQEIRQRRDGSWEHSKTRAVWCYNSTVAEPASPTLDNNETPK